MSKITCPKCSGKGTVERERACDRCGGTGRGGTVEGVATEYCQRCSGSGREIYYPACPLCEGAGQVDDPREL